MEFPSLHLMILLLGTNLLFRCLLLEVFYIMLSFQQVLTFFWLPVITLSAGVRPSTSSAPFLNFNVRVRLLCSLFLDVVLSFTHSVYTMFLKFIESLSKHLWRSGFTLHRIRSMWDSLNRLQSESTTQ